MLASHGILVMVGTCAVFAFDAPVYRIDGVVGQFRFGGSNVPISSCAGRIWYRQELRPWTPLCRDGWSRETASVFCRSLVPAHGLLPAIANSQKRRRRAGKQAVVVRSTVSSARWLFRRVNCGGDESTLSECSVSATDGSAEDECSDDRAALEVICCGHLVGSVETRVRSLERHIESLLEHERKRNSEFDNHRRLLLERLVSGERQLQVLDDSSRRLIDQLKTQFMTLNDEKKASSRAQREAIERQSYLIVACALLSAVVPLSSLAFLSWRRSRRRATCATSASTTTHSTAMGGSLPSVAMRTTSRTIRWHWAGQSFVV